MKFFTLGIPSRYIIVDRLVPLARHSMIPWLCEYSNIVLITSLPKPYSVAFSFWKFLIVTLPSVALLRMTVKAKTCARFTSLFLATIGYSSSRSTASAHVPRRPNLKYFIHLSLKKRSEANSLDVVGMDCLSNKNRSSVSFFTFPTPSEIRWPSLSRNLFAWAEKIQVAPLLFIVRHIEKKSFLRFYSSGR